MQLRKAFSRILEQVLLACHQVYGERLITVAIYGSVGRNTPRPDSDIDLLIIAAPLPNGRLARVAELAPVEAKVEQLTKLDHQGVEIHTYLSPVIKTPEEVRLGSPLFLDMIEDAQILFDRDGFFEDYLKDLAYRLQRLGAHKIVRGNMWYWVLKPDYRPGEVFKI